MDGAERRRGLRHHAVDVAPHRDVGVDGDRGPTAVVHELDGLVGTFLVDVDDRDAGAMGGEQLGGGPPLPRAGAGDQRDAPVEKRVPAELGGGDAHRPPLVLLSP